MGQRALEYGVGVQQIPVRIASISVETGDKMFKPLMAAARHGVAAARVARRLGTKLATVAVAMMALLNAQRLRAVVGALMLPAMVVTQAEDHAAVIRRG